MIDLVADAQVKTFAVAVSCGAVFAAALEMFKREIDIGDGGFSQVTLRLTLAVWPVAPWQFGLCAARRVFFAVT